MSTGVWFNENLRILVLSLLKPKMTKLKPESEKTMQSKIQPKLKKTTETNKVF